MMDTVLSKAMISVFFYPKTLAVVCFSVIALLVAGLAAFIKTRRALAVSNERLETLSETLESYPDGYYFWLYDAVGFIRETHCSRRLAVMMELSQGTESSFDALLERFAPDSAEALSAALNDMRANDRPFTLILQGISRLRNFQVSGFRTQTRKQDAAVDTLWVHETTQTVQELTALHDKNDDLAKDNALLRQTFDTLPFPVWIRNEDLQIAACNPAYAAAVHAGSPEQAVLLGSEPVYEKSPRAAKVLAAAARAAGKERRAQEFVVIKGKRRGVEACEIPLPVRYANGTALRNGTVGFLRDITREQELENSINEQLTSHIGVLEHLKTAIAVFDADMCLQFYNTSYMNLWDLEAEWLDTSPTYSLIMDMLREKHRLPENRDFSAYKTREIKYFTSLVTATEDIMHLPSGITLRRMVTPHPQGGLLITYEDVTGHLTMERSMTVLNETQFTVLNHLREAVLLFGNDNRLKLANTAFLTLWQIGDADFNKTPLSVMEVLEKLKPFFENEENWVSLKEQLLGVITSHTGEIFQILRPDGKVLEFVSAGLPDGGTFVSFLDVTEEERSSSLVAEKETLFSRFKQTTVQAEKLRASFLEQLGREINPQLSAMGEALRLLGENSAKRFTQRQKECLQTVLDAGAELKTLFADLADLALIETGSAVLELDSVDVGALLNGIINAVKEQAKNKNVTIETHCPDDLPLLIADKKRLKQVLFYLTGNAISAAFKDGTVFLSARVEEKNLLLTIEEQSLDVKNDSDTANFATRDGFAAALIRGFIEMHGGALTVSDKKGMKKTQISLPVH